MVEYLWNEYLCFISLLKCRVKYLFSHFDPHYNSWNLCKEEQSS
jgi:hypothetical protein